MTRTFRYTPISTDDLTATDLRGNAMYMQGCDAYRLVIYNDDGTPAAETAEALYDHRDGLLGIAWGADATWAEVKDLESGIEMWLNDGDAWEAPN